jgi:amino-acid N-acetyltransferase
MNISPAKFVANVGATHASPLPLGIDTERLVVRTATVEEAGAIHSLIVEHLAEGHLLPRQLEEIAIHAHRFIVAVQDDRILACAELAPLSRDVSEVRSFVVGHDARSLGLGRQLIDELLRRATDAGFSKLCAFTHAPGFFVHLGFSIVPHVWVPEKIVTDCHSCVHFRQCGQYAVVQTLSRTRHSFVPLATLHG